MALFYAGYKGENSFLRSFRIVLIRRINFGLKNGEKIPLFRDAKFNVKKNSRGLIIL